MENKANSAKLCFHCGSDKDPILKCDVWGINTCTGCKKIHHLPHHKSCYKAQDLEDGAEQIYFNIRLNRVDGSATQLKLQKGQELIMEEHWAGTYLFFDAGVMLVTQSRKEIDDLVLQGLRTLP